LDSNELVLYLKGAMPLTLQNFCKWKGEKTSAVQFQGQKINWHLCNRKGWKIMWPCMFCITMEYLLCEVMEVYKIGKGLAKNIFW